MTAINEYIETSLGSHKNTPTASVSSAGSSPAPGRGEPLPQPPGQTPATRRCHAELKLSTKHVLSVARQNQSRGGCVLPAAACPTTSSEFTAGFSAISACWPSLQLEWHCLKIQSNSQKKVICHLKREMETVYNGVP